MYDGNGGIIVTYQYHFNFLLPRVIRYSFLFGGVSHCICEAVYVGDTLDGTLVSQYKYIDLSLQFSFKCPTYGYAISSKREITPP